MVSLKAKEAYLIIRKPDGNRGVLFVREHNEPQYRLPMCKRDRSETLRTTLRATIKEQLGADVEGVIKVSSALEQLHIGLLWIADIFEGKLVGKPKAYPPIEEIRWMTKDEAHNSPDLIEAATADIPLVVAKVKTKLLVAGLELLVLIAASYIVQRLYPNSFLGGFLFLFGAVFWLGINAIILLLALMKSLKSMLSSSKRRKEKPLI